MNKYKTINVDGNTATSKIAYFLSEVAEIYPITPSSAMAENCDEWVQNGKTNIFGNKLLIKEMQSEAGAAGALHGSLSSGAISTTFTASQGLLLMIPNMYKIAGELLPTVFHISARALATHALSIFGDHSDVMACRTTGFNMLCSNNVQECQDLALVAHIASLETSLPFIHFFDGFRTSHEVQKIYEIDENDIKKIYPFDKVQEFRKKALDPLHPMQKGTAQNPDIYFQNREACNKYYNNVYSAVVEAMDKVASITGRKYLPFEYYGTEDAEKIIVIMGSGAETCEETVDYLNNQGEKVGVIKVRLYRPFNTEAFVKTIPQSVKKIAVLDRTKESGAVGEPLYIDVLSAISKQNRKIETIVGGRYGLGSKEFTPNCVLAVFENLDNVTPLNSFSVGIEDDVTNLSLPLKNFEITSPNTKQFKFYGLGSDGTVSANKNSIKIIGEETNNYTQGFFEYDSKKSGSITISHLRISDKSIKSTYVVTNPDFIAIHNYSFLARYDLISNLKNNGIILLNTSLNEKELSEKLPIRFVNDLKEKNAKLYVINGEKIAEEVGLGNKINIIMQSAFFKLSNLLPHDLIYNKLKNAIIKTYGRKGEKVINSNISAIDRGFNEVIEINIQNLKGKIYEESKQTSDKYFNEYIKPINQLSGNKLPVSSFAPDGVVPTDTTKFEKRGIANHCPNWNSEKCIQCGQCVISCPHACLRPILVTDEQLKNKPKDFTSKNALGVKDNQFRIQLSPLDCTGCGVCQSVCPAKEKAIEMVNAEKILEIEKNNLEFANSLTKTVSPFQGDNAKSLQFKLPYFEYSYACAGCGETPYIKLATTLFGDKMVIANATGCSSIYGGSAPACPYAKDENGKGPAWANSLFEDNAEFGLGIKLGINAKINNLKNKINKLINIKIINNNEIINLFNNYLNNSNNSNSLSQSDFEILINYLNNLKNDLINNKLNINNILLNNNNINNNLLNNENKNEITTTDLIALVQEIIDLKDYLLKKSVWIIGGDGWAYDIGYGGLDHILASGENINILVLDTEVYSNTGGQSSKSTPSGAFAKFAMGGKITAKKDLGAIAMNYPDVYVASVSLGSSIPQAIKAFKEAEAHNGPSIIIAYAPCINHGINMANSSLEMKKAVESGYWFLYRRNPDSEDKFILDSKEPTLNYEDFILGETRYASLMKTNPSIAKQLFEKSKSDALERYNNLKKHIKQTEIKE